MVMSGKEWKGIQFRHREQVRRLSADVDWYRAIHNLCNKTRRTVDHESDSD